MSVFARAFNVVYPDGSVLHGVQFPDGRCVLALWLEAGGFDGFDAAIGFEHLCIHPTAVVEWADGGQP